MLYKFVDKITTNNCELNKNIKDQLLIQNNNSNDNNLIDLSYKYFS